jgi:hypothetical protein
MEFKDRVPGRTIPASGEMTWFQRYYPGIAFVMESIFGIAGGIYLAFFLGPDILTMQLAGAVLMILMPVGGVFTYLILTMALQRGAWPVLLYRDGVEFHQFTFNRVFRVRSFVPVSKLTEVRVQRNFNTRSSRPASRLPYLNFIAGSKGMYTAGPRAEHDIEQALEYVRKEWPSVQITGDPLSSADGGKVVLPEPAASSPGKARKVPMKPSYAPTPPTAYEPWSAQSPYQPPMPTPYQAPIASTMGCCPSCGAGVLSGARFCPACGHQFGPSVQRPGMPIGEGKSAQVALLLSLLPGLAGFVGIGHFYVRKYVKGLFLLFLGFFFASMGFVSILMLTDPTTVWSPGLLMVVLVFNILFLMILIYSVIDVRKIARQFNMGTH